MRKVIVMLAAGSVLSGCAALDFPALPIAPIGYHPVSYYDAHTLERDQANAWCHDNPGLAGKNPSCDSADISGIHAFNHKMGFVK